MVKSHTIIVDTMQRGKKELWTEVLKTDRKFGMMLIEFWIQHICFKIFLRCL